MNATRITGQVDENRRLSVEVPDSVPPGPVTVLILSVSHEDDAADAWMTGIAREWADDLNDPRQDIYTLADGEPIRDS